MRERLERLRRALKRLNIRKFLARVREREEDREELRKVRKVTVRRRNRLREKYNALLDDGHDPEEAEMQELAEEIQLHDRKAEALDTRLGRQLRKLNALRRETRKRERQRPELEARIRLLLRKIRLRKRRSACGSGPYAGSQSVGERAVVKVAEAFGAFISSRKRAASHPLSQSNPSSDHNEANENAYAWDIATFNGAPIAHQIAKELGISNYSTGNFNTYIVSCNGRNYRVQILWGVSVHFNHVHVGIRAI